MYSPRCLLLAWILAFVSNVCVGQTDQKQTTVKPKSPGMKRVGVLLPGVTLKNAGDKVDPAEAVRETFGALLNSGGIELIPLDARLTTLAYKESLDKECDYVLKITLTQGENKKGGFLDRIIDRTADAAVTETTSRIPKGGKVASGVGREAVVGAGQQVNAIEFAIKKGDQIVLEYRLSTPKVQSVRENSINAKAKKDNDDVLLPLIERAAEEIAAFLIG